MALVTGKLKVSKARLSANNDRSDHCHQYLQELQLSEAAISAAWTTELRAMYHSPVLIWYRFDLTWTTFLWEALSGMNNPRLLLITEYSFFLFPFFFLIFPLSLSLTILHDNTQRKAIRKHITSIRDSAISPSFIGHPSCLHSKETYILFRTHGNNIWPQGINGLHKLITFLQNYPKWYLKNQIWIRSPGPKTI